MAFNKAKKQRSPEIARAFTIRDVAARAGVSIATVSRVMNQSGAATPATATRVREAISELGFRPSQIGRSLKTSKSRTIGVLVPSLANPVFAESIAGIELAAQRAGYSVLLATSHYNRHRETAAIETLRAHWVDGLILTVVSADDSPSLDLLDAAAVPYVLIYNQPHRSDRAAVTVDNVAAARDAVASLVALGHRRIAMLAGVRAASDRTILRQEGFEAAMRAAGLTPGQTLEVDFEALDAERAVAALFDGPEAPTALFCGTDLIAIAAMKALSARGLSVPKDVSIVGFDGIAVGAMLQVPLTTIEMPVHAMGERAVEQLLRQLNAHAAPETLLLPYVLRAGATTSRPAWSKIRLP
jgi:DNA-binding LacI/PurR family transcriptional regulator